MNINDLTIDELETLKSKITKKLHDIESAEKVVIWNYERMGLVSRQFTTFESALAYFTENYEELYLELAQKYEKNRGGYASVYNNAPKLVPEMISPTEFEECKKIGLFEDLNPSK